MLKEAGFYPQGDLKQTRLPTLTPWIPWGPFGPAGQLRGHCCREKEIRGL